MDVSSVRFPPGAKSISPDMSPTEIVKSLKRCCKFFSQLEQEQEEEKKIYLPFCLYIAESDFVNEITDANARIHLGCIFADIFRLHAPENPFPADKTKDIFLFLASQLAHLQNVKSALFSKAYHILENISAVKSFIICLELDGVSSDEVFYELFKVFFSLVNSSHDDQLKVRMLDVMVCIIAESDALSQRVFDVILECLLEKGEKMNPSAYELARELLRKTSQNMEGVVMLFFQNTLLGEHEEMNSLMRRWPRLLSQLYKISGTFFTNAVPQLEMKLRTDNVRDRIQVVKLLAHMFSEKDSGLSSQHPGLWNSFLARFNDIEPEVRTVCVRFCSNMMINHGGRDSSGKKVLVELVELLKLRRHDADEGVRVSVIVAIRAVAMQSPDLVSDELLVFLRERLLDKKHKVRETAIRAVADVYKTFSAISTAPIYKIKLGMLQSQLLKVYYTQNFEDCILIERILVSSLVRYSLPNGERMKRLLQLYCTVDQHATKAITEMFKKQKILRSALKDIMSAMQLEENERNKKIWPCILSISAHLQSPLQAREHVKKLISMARCDTSIQELLEYLVCDQYTSHKVALAVRDILNKLEKSSVNKVNRQTIQQLLEKAVLATILVDSSSLLNLARLVDEIYQGTHKLDGIDEETAKERGMDLLYVLAKHDPNLFAENECFEILLTMLRGKEETLLEKSLLILHSTAPIIEKKFKAVRSILLPELKAIARTAPPTQAKYAVRCVNLFSSVREAPLMQVFHHCKKLAEESSAPSLKLRTLLTTMGCVAECLPQQAGKEMKGFIAVVVVKKIIMQTNLKTSKRKELKWCEKFDVSEETLAKLVAMKCMIRWLCGLKSNESDCCGSSLRLLQHMMHNDGDLMKCGRIPKSEMAHLRLQAAYCVLRIARCDVYKDLIPTTIFMELAVLLMDELREVRQHLLSKLYKTLFKFQVHISFMSLFWVISQEKVKEHRDQGTTMYRQLILRYRALSKDKAMHSIMPEYALSFAIHLLASDPDIPLKDDIPKSVLSRIKDSLNFMLDPLLTREHPESFGFIKRLAEMIKRTKLQDDSEDHLRSKTLYRVCDLVLQSVLVKSGQYAIGIIEPPDEAVKKFLPPRLYTRLNAEENHQNYLPEAFQVETRLVPIRVTTTAKQRVKTQPAAKQTAKYRQLVAVTKVALPSQSDTSDICSPVSETKSPAKKSTKPLKKRKSVEYLSSDEESLASKKYRLAGNVNQTERKKFMKNQSDSDRRQKGSEGNAPKHKQGTSYGSSDNPQKPRQLSPASDDVTGRPKRSSAGSKMFHYLNSVKRTPTKSKSDIASDDSTTSRRRQKRTVLAHRKSKKGKG